MSLVVFEDVGLALGRRDLMDGVDLRVGAHDRIGVVGPNGSGKTSLLRLVAGELQPDRGQVRRRRELRIGYLPQDLPVLGGVGLLDSVLAAAPGREALEHRLAEAEARLHVGDDEARIEAAGEVAELHEELGELERHYSPHVARRILAGLGFRDREHERDLGELSGGWKMRAVLARLLFERPDLLLLDEPTNHLDMPSVAFFGDWLKREKRSFLLICHDREFLDEQIERVVSFEPEGVRQYRGDYAQYVRQRAEEEEVLANRARNLGREREKAEQFIDRFRAQANKAKAVQSRVKALAKLEEVELPRARKTLSFSFPPCARAGAWPIRVRGLRKAFGDHVVFAGVDLVVARGEKVAIIGHNGAGKTTLLRMLADELPRDGGEIELGHGVELGYFAQHHAETLDRRQTAYEAVHVRAPAANDTRVRSVLGAFLFGEDDVDKKVGVLSGGERARVALARLLIAPGNLMLMDEPTNHLDLASSEALADALARYDGTLVFVSHNRSFVRRLATRIVDVADGDVHDYPGTLDEYLEHCRTGVRVDAPAPAAPAPSASSRPASTERRPAVAPAPSRADARQARRERAQQRGDVARRLGPLRERVRALEADIAAVEAAQKQRSAALSDPSTYEDPARRTELMVAYQREADRLGDLVATWEVALAELEDAQASAAE